mgnify:CR=1 FL=1
MIQHNGSYYIDRDEIDKLIPGESELIEVDLHYKDGCLIFIESMLSVGNMSNSDIFNGKSEGIGFFLGIFKIRPINEKGEIEGFKLETYDSVINKHQVDMGISFEVDESSYFIDNYKNHEDFGVLLHHWHHDLERDAGNYANISPLMDIIFGTYTCPDHEPEKFGIKEWFPKNYVGQIIYPILPKFVAKRLGKIK